MPRARTALALAAALAPACGGSSVPKPWSRTEGQQEVVGNQSPGHHGTRDVGSAGAPPAQPARGGVSIRSPDVRVEGPPAHADLPPVAEDYESLYAVGTIPSCPEGTTLADRRAERGELACVLPDGTRHGPAILFYPDGAVKEIAPYRNGLREGRVTTWRRDGDVYSRYTWKDGAPVDGEVYHR